MEKETRGDKSIDKLQDKREVSILEVIVLIFRITYFVLGSGDAVAYLLTYLLTYLITYLLTPCS